MSCKFLEITKASYLGKYRMEFTFNDGRVVKVSFLQFLKKSKNQAIRKYLKEDLFKKFSIIDGDVIWGDYDLIFPIIDLYQGNILHEDAIMKAS